MHTATYDDLNVVTLEDLQRIVTFVSLEANGSAGFFADARARFSQFFGKADSFFKQMTFQTLGIGKVDTAPLMKYIQKHGFVDAAKAEVIVPNGFTGHWMPYAELLADIQKKAIELPAAIDQFNIAVGKLISDPELMKSASGIEYTTTYKFDRTLDDGMRYVAKAYFDPKLERIRCELGSVLARQADLPRLTTDLNALIYSDKINPASNVVKAVNRTMDLAKQLMPIMDSDPLVSKAVKEQMISITYQLATEVEAYSTLLFRIRQLVLAVEDSGKELAKG